MKKSMKTFCILVLVMLSLVGCCRQEPLPAVALTLSTPTEPTPDVFVGQPSPVLTLSPESAEDILAVVRGQQTVYPYRDLYALEEVQQRLSFDITVTEHQYSALNGAGQLDGDYLTELVMQNNGDYLAGKPFGFEPLDRENVALICQLIAQTVQQMQLRYPDLDWDRVYCNLGDLKILNRAGMLAYAQVNGDHVLSVSPGNASIAEALEGRDGFSRVLVHETIHLLQLGCSCEAMENCGRRAGISVYWEDFPQNTADWPWFIEGAAERYMCQLTGGEAVSYQYKMDYLCSFNFSILLREDARADTMEHLSFQRDPSLLFEAFGCRTQAEQEEVLMLMITTNVLQSEPSGFYNAYTEAYGVDPRDSDEMLNAFRYSLKPAICTTLSREFYENLTVFLRDESITADDLCFLLNLFEGHLNQHLSFTKESQAACNAPFLEDYGPLRQALFDALDRDNPGLHMAQVYAGYEIGSAGACNAVLAMLPQEKRDFLAERAAWQEKLLALGVKVP